MHRTWTLWGSVVAIVAAATLAALALDAHLTEAPLTLHLVLIGLLLMSAVVLSGMAVLAARIITAIGRYRDGVGDTVDRLATALDEARQRNLSP